MKKYKIAELVIDFELYPRGKVDSHHVGEIAYAIEAGTPMPPVIIDKKSKRVIDGVHRINAYRRLYDETHEIDCAEKEYKNDKEMFVDAMRYNSAHGRALSQHDKLHCILMAEKFKISTTVIAEALHITTDRIGALRSERVGTLSGSPIALKQTIRHMGGQKLTKEQVSANEKLGGMNALFYINQIILLIENDLIDTSNADLQKGLAALYEALGQFLERKAA